MPILQGYSGAGWDPRTSSAFSPLQPPQAPVAHKTTSAHGFDLKSFEQKATSNFEQKGFDLKGFDQKVGQGFDASSHFAKVSTQSAVQQDMKALKYASKDLPHNNDIKNLFLAEV